MESPNCKSGLSLRRRTASSRWSHLREPVWIRLKMMLSFKPESNHDIDELDLNFSEKITGVLTIYLMHMSIAFV